MEFNEYKLKDVTNDIVDKFLSDTGDLNTLTKEAYKRENFNKDQGARLVESVNKEAFLKVFPEKDTFKVCDPSYVLEEKFEVKVPMNDEKTAGAEDYEGGMFKKVANKKNIRPTITINTIQGSSLSSYDMFGVSDTDLIKSASADLPVIESDVRKELRERDLVKKASEDKAFTLDIMTRKFNDSFDSFVAEFKKEASDVSKTPADIYNELATEFPTEKEVVLGIMKKANDHLSYCYDERWLVKTSSLNFDVPTSESYSLNSTMVKSLGTCIDTLKELHQITGGK